MTQKIGFSIIADRYAEAMLELAEKAGVVIYVKNDFAAIASTLDINEDFKNFIEHPLISIKEKKEVIETIFKNKVNDYLVNLMKLLLDRNRMFLFNAIADSFKIQHNKKYNIISAEVITAIPIDEKTTETIKTKLSTILKTEIELTTKVDQEIIGGVVVKFQDQVIDGSIKGRLESIKKLII